MDERKTRIGEHAATSALPWAVTALGPVPADGPERLGWQRRASSIGAYRELSGYGHPADPIGPEPLTGTPDLRAAWHEALAALGTVDGPDVRGMPDGRLLHLRDTYPVETAWEEATRQQRQLAIAADAELRRRHPDQPHPPLRSAEPRPGTRDQHDEPVLNAHDDIEQTKDLIAELTAQRREFARQYSERARLMLPSADPDYGHEGQALPAWTPATTDAILQPPKPQIEPSARILVRVIGHDLDLEAAD